MSTSKIEAVVATPRTGTFNKGHARRVRVSGLIPAVVYGAGQESVAVTVDPRVITKILYSESGHNTIFDLAIEGKGTNKVMIVDWQHEPIKGKLLHIDLKRIAMDKAMRVSIPVQLIGVPVGVKSNGGVLGQVLHEVEVECLPGDIPDHIDIDVTNLDINGAIHISDLPHSDKLKFLGEEDALVAHVTIAKEEAAVEPVAGPSEPEVAKKGKQDAPAADAAGDKKK
ncbi:50S ribosomal protein L25 [Granulicella mallensis]|uniref:Large ribosomal subunit protein bL25 n=1 Tax=Granulicella mallensis TaxID=940614 RepID=A0A7W7ZNE2_9BACT|nr:50S ribosomal protein L25 [Granulicella mallensis]MBB5063189.1 large subunit ribosomal protein L25 [Granulicella mallensis]